MSSSKKQNVGAVAANNSPQQQQQKHKSPDSAGRSCSSPQKKKKKKAPSSATSGGGFTLDRVNDIVDFETDHIMMLREDRQEHFDTFMYFWNLHPASDLKSGRRFARFLIAQILVIASGKNPYTSMMRKRGDNQDNNDDDDDDTDNDDDEDDDDTNSEKGVLCLNQWSRVHWEKLHDELQLLRQVLLRDDATINYSSMSDTTTLGFPSVSAASASAAASKPTNPSGVDDSSDDDNDNDNDDDHCKLVALSPRLGKKFNRLLRFIEINKAIAPIREQLEQQIRKPIKVSDSDNDNDDENNNNNNDVVVVETKELIEIIEYADEIKDETVKKFVLCIFHPSAQEDDGKTPSLKTRKQLTKILQNTNAYNLESFQNGLDKFLLKFAKQVFGNADIPTLVKLGYTNVGDVDDDDEATTRSLFEASDNGSKKKKAPTTAGAVRGESREKDNGKRRRRLPKELKELKRGRDALNNNHGDDPREESLRIMEQAKRAAGLKNKRRQRKSSGGGRQDDEEEEDENNSPRNDDDDDDEDSGLEQQQQQRHRAPSGSATKRRQGTKRKEGHILDESSSDESDDDDDELEKEHAAITISQVPTKKKARVVAETQSKMYGLPPPDPGIFDAYGNVLKRCRWTDEENTAIKQGVTMYGVGKWAEIKTDYGFILKNRTTVQIKDRYRTMVKNNEL